MRQIVAPRDHGFISVFKFRHSAPNRAAIGLVKLLTQMLKNQLTEGAVRAATNESFYNYSVPHVLLKSSKICDMESGAAANRQASAACAIDCGRA